MKGSTLLSFFNFVKALMRALIAMRWAHDRGYSKDFSGMNGFFRDFCRWALDLEPRNRLIAGSPQGQWRNV